MTVTARCDRRTGSFFWSATDASPSRKVRPTGLSTNSGVEAAAMRVLHNPSEGEISFPGMSAWEVNPERSSAVLVRSPCGSSARRLALSSSNRVMSMGPTVMPRKKEMLIFLSSGMMLAVR